MVSPGDSVLVQVNLADQRNKLTLITIRAFLVVAIHKDIVIIQTLRNSEERISLDFISKSFLSQENDNLHTQPHLHDHFIILNVVNRRRLHVLAPHNSARNEKCTGSKAAKFDHPVTPLCDIAQFRAMGSG